MNTRKILETIGLVILVLVVLQPSQSVKRITGQAPSGLMGTVATSSQSSVGTTAVTLFATSTCAARIITTYASPIMLTFNDYKGEVPTGTFGTLQAASTTVAYDSGLYGCGAVKAFGFVTDKITVTETR